MTNRRARCAEVDIKRALRAVQATGAPMAVEILPDGTIRIAPTPTNNNPLNGLIECLDNRPPIPL